jgi:hypothetical protein
MRRFRPQRLLPFAVVACTLLALAACGNDSTPTPTPALTTAPTGTPTPTVPVPAEDDPTWTKNQSAAVRMVDAFNDVVKKMVADPTSAEFSELAGVAVNPEYESRVGKINRMSGNQISQPYWVIPVRRDVGAEAVVDGRTEIKVTQCNEDDPRSVVIVAGAERPVAGDPRVWYEYTVQWQDDLQDWRVAVVTDLETTC